MIPDYHTHSVYSDGKDEHYDYLRQATYAGIDELGFSDHFSIYNTSWGVKKKHISELKEEMNFIKKMNEFSVSVKAGAEIDFVPGKEKTIRELILNLAPDYVIGSVHFLGTWNFDTDPEGFKEQDIDQIYEWYFTLLRRAIQSGLYDIIGHPDLIKKFGYYPSRSPYEWYKKIIRSLKRKDVVIEINTNGMNKPCREFYPEENFIRLCFQSNIPITLGSDAHEASQVGQYFGRAIEMLKNIGYRQIATFENRKRTFQPL